MPNTKTQAAEPRTHRCAGFSLLEVMIATAILSIAIATTLALVSTGQKVISTGIAYSTLDGRARQVMDRVSQELHNAVASSVFIYDCWDGSFDQVEGDTYAFRQPPLGPPDWSVTSYGFWDGMSWVTAYERGIRLSFYKNTGDVIPGTYPPAFYTSDRIYIYAAPDTGEVFNGLDDDNDGLIDEGVLWRVCDHDPIMQFMPSDDPPDPHQQLDGGDERVILARNLAPGGFQIDFDGGETLTVRITLRQLDSSNRPAEVTLIQDIVVRNDDSWQ